MASRQIVYSQKCWVCMSTEQVLEAKQNKTKNDSFEKRSTDQGNVSRECIQCVETIYLCGLSDK